MAPQVVETPSGKKYIENGWNGSDLSGYQRVGGKSGTNLSNEL